MVYLYNVSAKSCRTAHNIRLHSLQKVKSLENLAKMYKITLQCLLNILRRMFAMTHLEKMLYNKEFKIIDHLLNLK
jgi:Mor family transcriptional regulator